MSEAATLIPVNIVIAMLTAISDRSWGNLKHWSPNLLANTVWKSGKMFLTSVSNQHWIKILTDGCLPSGAVITTP